MGGGYSTDYVQDHEHGVVLTGAHLNDPEDVQYLPYFPTGSKMLLARCLTKETWKALKNERDSHGFSFRQAIFSGCKFINSGVGVYAGSHDSYYTFSKLFDPIIEIYHQHPPQAKHTIGMDPNKLNCPPLPASYQPYILSTRIRVARNLSSMPLGACVSRQQLLQIEEAVVNALNGFQGDLSGKYYSLGKMSEADRQQLVEDHFLFKGGDKYLQAASLERFWPQGRGIFHNNEKTFLVWVNEEDQLRIISMQNDSNVSQVFGRLAYAIQLLEQQLDFQKDSHLGYISSCPTNLGTGLRGSMHVKLPKLSQKPELM